MPNFSVVVRTRNRAATLEVTLRSLVAQDWPASDYEIVVVDDGSTDETPAVVASFADAEGPAVRYARQEHSGAGAARNRGAQTASGDLICYVDDDTQAEVSWLREVASGAARHPDAACFAGRLLLRLEGKPPSTCEREYLAANLDAGNEEQAIDRAIGANMAIRRSALDEVGLFNEALRWQWDETEWVDRLSARGGQIIYLPGAIVWHRRTQAELRRFRLLVDRFGWGRCFPVYARITGQLTPVWPEIRFLLVALLHGLRRRCFGGPLMVSYRLGVLTAIVRHALSERLTMLRSASRFTDRMRQSPRS